MGHTGKRGVGIPIVLLHDGEGSIVTIEVKNGDTYRGYLDESEDNMNCIVKDATLTTANALQYDAALQRRRRRLSTSGYEWVPRTALDVMGISFDSAPVSASREMCHLPRSITCIALVTHRAKRRAK